MAKQKNEQASVLTSPEYVTVAFNSPKGIFFTLGTKTVHINGNNGSLVGKEKGLLSVGLYGYTRVLSEDWEAIKKTYGSMDIFKNALIFAENSKERSEDRADEQKELRNGFEPIDTKRTKTIEAEQVA